MTGVRVVYYPHAWYHHVRYLHVQHPHVHYPCVWYHHVHYPHLRHPHVHYPYVRWLTCFIVTGCDCVPRPPLLWLLPTPTFSSTALPIQLATKLTPELEAQDEALKATFAAQVTLPLWATLWAERGRSWPYCPPNPRP